MYARTLSVAAAAIVAATAANAAPLPASGAPSETTVITIAKQGQRKDCTPYNGPYGFYGNIWCQPPSEQSYLRNLGSPWPQETPPALKGVKPDNSSDW